MSKAKQTRVILTRYDNEQKTVIVKPTGLSDRQYREVHIFLFDGHDRGFTGLSVEGMSKNNFMCLLFNAAHSKAA